MGERISHELMARRVAAELVPGQVISLGTGLPEMVPALVPTSLGVMFLTANGVIGCAPPPMKGASKPEVADGIGEATAIPPGGAVVHQADSFGIVRGGHVDVGVVEALQVSQGGDLVYGAAQLVQHGATGGMVDVAAGARHLVAMMEHTNQDGSARIVREPDFPITGRGCVDLIVTDVAVIRVTGEGLVVKELATGWTMEEAEAITGAPLTASRDLKEIEYVPARSAALDKVCADGAAAVADIPNGAVVLLDGFAGPGGMAQYLIMALRDQGARELTMVSNTAGIARVASFGTPPGFRTIDHSLLVDNGQIRKAVASFPVSPSASRPNSFELAYKRGKAELELELVPQGTLAERIRAGGYGIAAFYTPTGAGTLIAEGKHIRVIDGRECVLEHAIRGDYALIRAHKADRMGNLVYQGTSRNFNAVMAPAAAITIAEVDDIMEVGELDPDAIVTPGVFVQRIVRRPREFSPYESLE